LPTGLVAVEGGTNALKQRDSAVGVASLYVDRRLSPAGAAYNGRHDKLTLVTMKLIVR
jgi:hypothetical protein